MSDAPATGDLFAERFMLHELLIRSPVGPAFRAYDRDVDDVVALLILDDAAASAGAEEQLRHQVRVARRVTHRNIARTYDMAEHEGRRFVTMEYIDGVRLPQWLAGAPSQAAIVDVSAQIAEGLAVAHDAGVVHCNVTPFNIMVEPGGRAVLGNFGLSRFEAAETLFQITNPAGEMLRSATYLAPEQVLGQPPSAAVDVYALALLLFEMLTGQPRFSGTQPVLVANARLHDALDDLLDPRRRDARISEPLARLIAACLAREPDERPAAAALAFELRVALRGLTGTGETSAPTSSGPVRRHDSLAVLPFRYRGPRESDYLSDALFDELVDLLSRTRGLRVLASGATSALVNAGDRDPKQLGTQLGVDVIVDGTILLVGERLRISARLVEVADGFQLWHERFEGDVADVFELQDKMAKRIAEALRVELEIIAHHHGADGSADGAAVEHYLRGRQAHHRWNVFGPDGAIAHYRAALERCPEFKPALANLAAATLLAWFQPHAPDGVDYGRESELAVERAMQLAPELPATRLAAGKLAIQHDDYQAAATHLVEALHIAPTYALAHELLGRLLLESGRCERGVEHLELSIELDPTLYYCLTDIGRHHALHGDLDAFAACTARLLELIEHHRPSTGLVHIRVGAWTRDEAMIRKGIQFLTDDGPRSAGIRRFGELLLEPAADMESEYQRVLGLAVATSPRLHALVEQLSAEQAAFHHDLDRAMRHLDNACALGLVDLEWLERCPLLEPLRERPEYTSVRARVRARSDAIWAVVRGRR